MLSRRSLLRWLVGAGVTASVGIPASMEVQAQSSPGRRGRWPARSEQRPPAPRPRFEHRPQRRPGFVWVPGRWVWNSRRGEWVWVSGHWVRRSMRR
jgi:WXXGXW repeat (2 copies)